MLNSHLAVKSYPSYILVDKRGRITTTKAPKPSSGEILINAIKELQNQDK